MDFLPVLVGLTAAGTVAANFWTFHQKARGDKDASGRDIAIQYLLRQTKFGAKAGAIGGLVAGALLAAISLATDKKLGGALAIVALFTVLIAIAGAGAGAVMATITYGTTTSRLMPCPRCNFTGPRHRGAKLRRCPKCGTLSCSECMNASACDKCGATVESMSSWRRR